MELSGSDKAKVLLYALDWNFKEIVRKEREQLKLFEWSTGLLLAAFAATVALSGISSGSAHSFPVKVLATALISVPTALLIYRIVTRTKDSVGNAQAAEAIEEMLHLFEDGYYGAQAPFPKQWQGGMAKLVLTDKLPLYLAFIIFLMATCVVLAIWLLL